MVQFQHSSQKALAFIVWVSAGRLVSHLLKKKHIVQTKAAFDILQTRHSALHRLPAALISHAATVLHLDQIIMNVSKE